MNNKYTLRFLFFLLTLFVVQTSTAQLYSNGAISTGTTATNGTIAPVNYSWSEVPSNFANTLEANSTIGISGFFNTAATTNFRLADDFTVPSGASWDITDFSFYCYQTGYTGTIPPVDVLRVQIFSGDPATGGTLVAGDMITNIYDIANSGEAFVYRTSNTLIPTPSAVGTTRKVWKIRGNITTSLGPGVYWLVFQVHAANDASIFFPAVTVLGSRGAAAANAKQLTVSTSTWGTVVDLGNPATAPDFPQDIPFLINENTLSIQENNLQASISVHPNPLKNFAFISNTSSAQINSAEILDLNGRLIKKDLVVDSQITVSNLQTGMYLLKLITDKGIVIKKIIKE